MSRPKVERQKLERRVDAAIQSAGADLPAASSPTDCFAHYAKHLLEYSDYAKSTICTSFNQLEIFHRWMESTSVKSLADLSLQDLRRFFAYCKTERKMKSITMRGYRVELNRFFLYLGHIGALPDKRLLLDRIRFTGQTVEIDILPPEELSAMIRTARADCLAKKDAWRFDITFKAQRNLCILYLLIATGLRPSEVVGIQKSDIQWDKKCIHINGKGNNLYVKRYRKAYIDQPDLKETLSDYLRLRSHLETEFLFCSWDGIPLRSMYISTMVRTLGLAAGLGKIVNPTTLRHTFCSHLAARGVDLFCIKELMGHKWIDTALAYYTHFPEIELHKQAVRFNPLGGGLQ